MKPFAHWKESTNTPNKQHTHSSLNSCSHLLLYLFTLALVYFSLFAMPQPFSFHTLSNLPEKVAKPYHNAHAQVLHSKTCIYHSRFHDSVEWMRDGNCHKLVLKPAAPTPNLQEVAPEMAILSLICTIISDDFWMTANGGWKGLSAITKMFSTIKPSCMLEAPGIDVLQDDFVTGISNLQWVQDQITTHSISKKRVYWFFLALILLQCVSRSSTKFLKWVSFFISEASFWT